MLVGVAQVREIEFIANNPGDWMLHCHMFHHVMNFMSSMVGPMGGHTVQGMRAGQSPTGGMGIATGGPALSDAYGPSLGRSMGEQTGIERCRRQHDGHARLVRHAGNARHVDAGGSPLTGGMHGGHGAMGRDTRTGEYPATRRG